MVAVPWYGEAVRYKLFGVFLFVRMNARLERKVKQEASKLILIDIDGAVPKLGRYETSGEVAECVRAHKVEVIKIITSGG